MSIDIGNAQQVSFESRPYQNKAIGSINNFVKNLVIDNLDFRAGIKYQTSSLVEMATGSGKTFVIGKTLDSILNLRNRYQSIHSNNMFAGMNIVLLTNRIDGLDQFCADLTSGRLYEDEQEYVTPFLSEKNLGNLDVSRFHSQADDLEYIGNKIGFRNKNISRDINPSNTENLCDSLICITLQTSIGKNLANKLPYIDIILIDEAHNISPDGRYDQLIQELSTMGREGNSPLILPLTATPSNLTKQLFGEPVMSFGLEEYINSDYSPNIDYKMITNSNSSEEELKFLEKIILNAHKTTNLYEKLELLDSAGNFFEKMVTQFASEKHLVADLLQRIVVDGEINSTIIFVNHIDQADEIAELINESLNKGGVALSYHSKNSNNDAISRLAHKNDACKIVISVGKLNESIDIPIVKNIVFWRWTDSEKIFFQQFGRGLRGQGTISYFDYVGGIQNFGLIGNIMQKYHTIIDNENYDDNEEKRKKQNKFIVSGSNLESIEHDINLVDLGFQLSEMVGETEGVIYASKQQLQDLWKQGIFSLDDLLPTRISKFATQWNKENALEKGFIFPLSGNGLISRLGGDYSTSSTVEYIECLLNGEEYIHYEYPTVSQLSNMLEKGDIKPEYLGGKSYREFVKSWNSIQNKQKYNFQFPHSITALIQALGGDYNIAQSKGYILSLISGEKYVPRILINKEQIQQLWDEGIIDVGALSQKTYPVFARKWNKDNSDILGYELPLSFASLGRRIGIKRKINKNTILRRLDNKIILPIATKEQLQDLWKHGILIDENFKHDMFDVNRKWNETNSEKYGFKLPLSPIPMVRVLGGNIKTSVSGKYMLSLLNDEEFIKLPIVNKEQLIQLWQDQKIDDAILNGRKSPGYVRKWNKKYSEEYGFKLPVSLDSIKNILIGQRRKITKNHVVSILEGKEYIQLPISNKSQLQKLWKNGDIVKDNISLLNYSNFALKWNQENSEKYGFYLPKGIMKFISILGGDYYISKSQKYIQGLLEGDITLNRVSKDELSLLWIEGKLDFDQLTSGKISPYMKKWNQENSEQYGFFVPTSLDGLIGIMGGDRNGRISREVLINLLSKK